MAVKGLMNIGDLDIFRCRRRRAADVHVRDAGPVRGLAAQQAAARGAGRLPARARAQELPGVRQRVLLEEGPRGGGHVRGHSGRARLAGAGITARRKTPASIESPLQYNHPDCLITKRK